MDAPTGGMEEDNRNVVTDSLKPCCSQVSDLTFTCVSQLEASEYQLSDGNRMSPGLTSAGEHSIPFIGRVTLTRSEIRC